MNDPVVSVENLSKRYFIGHQRDARDGLRHAVEDAFRNPFKWLLDRKRRIAATREEFWALKDVSFEIKQGSSVGIIGKNGAGKSTLLKILSRVTEPTNGRVRLKGRVASLLEVGTGFHQELSGRENIFLNGAILGMSRAEIKSKFDEIVEFSEIEKFLDTPVKRYSSGMYVRLAFAVAAHLEPEILIVDEVLAVGDSAFQKKCMGKMGQVAKGGRTVIFVSHNMAAVRTLCSVGIVLAKGNLVTHGPVNSCIDRYIGNNEPQNSSNWERSPGTDDRPPLTFQSINASLAGSQPTIELQIKCVMKSERAHKPAMIAFDILDASGVALMQALPSPTGFIEYSKGAVEYWVGVKLPPMIPGRYNVTCWTGSHFSETFDVVNQAVSFEIDESPTLGRSFPHSVDHGSIVPLAEVKVSGRT